MRLHRSQRREERPAARTSIRLEHLEDRRLLAVGLGSTPGLYNPAAAEFYLRTANAAGLADIAFPFGPAGQDWRPIVGDWDGDDADTAGAYEPANSAFFLRNENSAGPADVVIAFGAAGQDYTSLSGDWNGDGIDTIGLYDPQHGWWFLRDANAPGIADKSFAYGPAGQGWLPIVGDWDGDGDDTVGLYEPSLGTFWLRNENSPGVATSVYGYGPAGVQWTPLSGDWNADGTDTLGLHSRPLSHFLLRDVHQPGPADVSFDYGSFGSNFVPLSGHWTIERPGDQTAALVNRAVVSKLGVQQMPSVAVDPHDPNHVVIAYMDYALPTADTDLLGEGYAGIGVAVSYDAGVTWQYSAVPLPEGFDQGAANPIAKFDDQGRVYVSFMAVTYLEDKPNLTFPNIFEPDLGLARGFGMRANNGVFVARSDDGGAVWNEAVDVASNLYQGEQVPIETEPDLTIDTVRLLPNGQPNPNYGNLYVLWTHYYLPGTFPGDPQSLGGGDLFIAVSKDAGQTWETKQQAGVTVIRDLQENHGRLDPGTSFVQQAHLTVGAQGDIYVANFGAGDFPVHMSDNGASTFDGPDHITGRRIAFGTGFTTFANFGGLPNNQFRLYPARAVAADPTRPGHVYAVDQIIVLDAVGNAIDGADVFFSRSIDFGVTWETTPMVGQNPADVEDLPEDSRVPLNDDNDNQPASGQPGEVIAGQALARLAVDAQGNIGVIWYDTRRDPADHLLDVFGTVSTDGGQTFSPNFRITDVSFDADDGRFINALGKDEFYIGDLIGLGLSNNMGYAAWTDTRAGNQDIFFARYSIAPAPGPLNDRFEPNNASAAGLPTELGRVIDRELPKLAVDGNDADWFSLEAAAKGDLVVTVSHAEPESRLQLELFDQDANLLATGEHLLDGQGNVTGEKIAFSASTGQKFLARVSLADTSGSTRYALAVQSFTADLGAQVHTTLEEILGAGDEAIYLLQAGALGSLELALTSAANVQGNLNLEVLAADDLSVLATGVASGSPGGGEIERVSLAIRQRQAVLIHVFGDGASQGDFTLELTNLDQFTTAQKSTLFVPSGAGPSSVEVGYLNGDDNPDIAVVDTLSDTVSVLLGSGDGTFQSARQFPIGAFITPQVDVFTQYPTFGRDIGLQDLDGDGFADLFVTNFTSGDVSILLGRGDGTFAPQRRFNATAPMRLDAGDFNQDSIPDLVTISPSMESAFTVSMLLGVGGGTFRSHLTTQVPAGGSNNAGTLRAVELNGDGKLDLVIGGHNIPQFSVLLGNGDGTFTTGGNFDAARLARAMALADINDDGLPDLVNAEFGGHDAAIALGNGDGTFQEKRSFFAGLSPIAVEVVDFASQLEGAGGSLVLGPRDGRPDLIVANAGLEVGAPGSGGPEVVVLPALFDQAGNFIGLGQPQRLASSGTPLDLKSSDLNGDGILDLTVVERDGILVIFGQPPAIAPNTTSATARDLGIVVHMVQPTLTITPAQTEAWFRVQVPAEVVDGAGHQVLDISTLIEHTAGAGLGVELLDGDGQVLATGPRIRTLVAQGAELFLRIFALEGAQGPGAGAYTLVLNVLPQVVSVEAAALLPGVGDQPGGPTTSIVLTLQGDRLDPLTAQNPVNYVVTWLGADGQVGGGDDQVVPLSAGAQPVVYAPSANRDIQTGIVYPTAIRQTITLLFDQPLPAGSYQIDVLPAVQTQDFNSGEDLLLARDGAFHGHPLVQSTDPNLSGGATIEARDLVFASGAIGDFAAFEQGTPFLSQLHDDLSSILDDILTNRGDDPNITDHINAHIADRVAASLAETGGAFKILVLWLDPVPIDLVDPDGDAIIYDPDAPAEVDPIIDIPDSFVDLDGNVELIVIPVDPGDDFDLTVSSAPDLARGGYVVVGDNEVTTQSLTNELRNDETEFQIDT